MCALQDSSIVYHARIFLMIASVYSFVEALPPRSPVMDLPSAMV